MLGPPAEVTVAVGAQDIVQTMIADTAANTDAFFILPPSLL
jgi:hypothetical protein